jgi:PAS domain S-box-containing protein
MKTPIRILYVDDYSLDRELVLDALQVENGGFQVTVAASRADFETALAKGDFDLILSDFNILGFEGLQVLEAVHAKDPTLPVVIVTGTGSEEIAVTAMKSGAADYVIKKPHHIRRLPLTVRAVLEKKQLDEERKQAELQTRRSEERLSRIFNASPIAISISRLTDSKIVDVNESYVQMFGYTREEAIGHTWFELGLTIDPDARARIVQSLREGGTLNSVEMQFRTKQGEIRDTLLCALMVELNGEVQSLSMIHDITKRKRAEAALLESEERFRQLTENIREILWLSDTGKKAMLYVGPGYELIWGRSRESLYTSAVSWLETIHPEDRERVLQAATTKQTAGTYDENYRIIRPDGSIRWIRDRAFPVRNAAGEIYRIAGVAEDITDRVQAEEARKSLEAQLQQAQKLESLGTLASGIAHDFNNILGIILGHASMLEKLPADPSTIRKNVDAILKASTRGAGLVRQMLTFARKTDVLIESVMLNDVVNEVTKLLHETLPRTITVDLDLQGDLPVIEGDATQINQVMLNLSVNARDAMPDGGTLTIATYRESGEVLRAKHLKAAAPDYVVLSVADTGIGMDEETQRRIFEPFFTTKERGKGTGLGLSLVFGIMERHNGFVVVQSELGKGTTFHCCFPLPQRVPELVQVEERTIKEIPGGSETILVVEDEELLRELVKALLESKGYTVLTAGDGDEALAIFTQRQNAIRLVLSDLGLPKFSGDELYRRLKTLKPDVLLILASGYIEAGMKLEIFRSGVKEFIQKPYNPNEVLRVIRSVLDHK